MFKVLHEFKQSARDFDNECIYCKYSQYALRESAKIAKALESEGNNTTDNIQGANGDARIENLVRMF